LSITISELKQKWKAEKDSYTIKEIGSGVQKFVKDVIKSPDLFNLKTGLQSTPLAKRRNEFLEEEVKKGARRADMVIFINPEIAIPVEIKKYRNIEAGVEQILQYQLDWEKQYGILTDGFTWRFYNNNVFREFNLNQMFEERELFLDFWLEYIKPESYYLNFFEPLSRFSFLKDMETLSVESARMIFFDDITRLIRSFNNKLNIEGYFDGLEKREAGRKAVEITYAYIIQFILYKTLVDNDFGEFKGEYRQRIESIHRAIKNKNYKDILGIINGISESISENIYRPFAVEQNYINQKLLKLFSSIENKLADVSPWLDIFVFIKKYNFANIHNEIFGYVYENYLKELYEEGKKGQYFTDPVVVDFMLELAGYTTENIKRRLGNEPKDEHISIIDPACGSGTFLYNAVDRIINAVPNGSEESSKRVEELINNNIYGLDIAEFPLYLAEMNILMRMLPLIVTEKYNNPIDKKIKVFKTQDSIAEFTDTNIKNTLNDLDVEYNKNGGQLEIFKDMVSLDYSSFIREESDIEEMKRSLENHKYLRRRFDFVIGNPPYVSYNECSKQNVLIFKLINQGQIRLNDIYGVNLHSVPNKRKKYRPNPNLYAFFIAVGLALLKDNGKLCFIIPQTILTANDLDVIRYHLAKYTTIEKIITFSGKMFIGRGLKGNKPVPTSSLIFVVSRKIPSIVHEVEIINYKSLDDDFRIGLNNISAGKKIKIRKIMQKKLAENISSWNFIKTDKKFLSFYDKFNKITDDISKYYEHVIADNIFNGRFYFDSGYSIDEKKLLVSAPKTEYFSYPKINSKYYTIKENRGFWPNIRKGSSEHLIKLRQANQGYNLLDSPYKVIWSYINPDKFHFTDIPVIWARNQICAIGSKNKEEVLYLLSILNSPINKLVLEANLKSENEKDLLLSTSSVKEFIRIPKITSHNQFIKDEIISRTDELIGLEEITLSHLVDFTGIMMQKFDTIKAEEKNLILIKGDDEIKCKIIKDFNLVQKAVHNRFTKENFFSESEITLSELKSLPVIDFEKQNILKEYIDDLVFALYFNVPITDVGIDEAEIIKNTCKSNGFYETVNDYLLKKNL